MTEFASLREALDALRESQDEYARAVGRFITGQQIDHKELWAEIEDLRDDLHAVANRIEGVAKFALHKEHPDYDAA